MKQFIKNRKKRKAPKEQTDSSLEFAYLMVDDQDDSQINKRLGDLKSFKTLARFAKPFKWKIFFSLGLIFISSYFAIVSSKLIGTLVEDGLVKKDLKISINYSIAILLCEILCAYVGYLGSKKLVEVSSRVIFSIRTKLFAKLQLLPMQYYDRQPQGRVVTRITHDVEGIEQFFTSSLGNLISAIMVTIISLTAMILADFKLGMIMFVGILPAFFVVAYTKDLIRDSNRRVSRTSSAINAKLSEYISGLETIRIYGIEDWSLKNFKKSVNEYLKFQLRGNILFATSMPLVSFLVSIPLIALVWFGGQGMMQGIYSLGLFVAFVRLYERFSSPLMILAREIHTVQEAFSNTERVFNFLNEDEEDAVLVHEPEIEIKHIHGEIEFKDVWMKYVEGDWVLKGLNFKIHAGEKIGLVGRTGCGKSSTVSLMSRLYEYQKGEIYIDGISIRAFDRDLLRSKIGFVSQDAIIFKGTLRENLSSDEAISDTTIANAAKETGLFKSLAKEGFNLNMEILENGANLSVGQKQLLSLTRVLILDPSILILDEATANIDPHYEAIIQEAVWKIMDGRTCLIIAHRLDTLNECNRIFVFRSGELIEQGSMQELVENKSYFYDLHHAKEQNL